MAGLHYDFIRASCPAKPTTNQSRRFYPKPSECQTYFVAILYTQNRHSSLADIKGGYPPHKHRMSFKLSHLSNIRFFKGWIWTVFLKSPLTPLFQRGGLTVFSPLENGEGEDIPLS